jgi:hypothetical protein
MRKHVLVSAALALGLLGAAGVSAQTLSAFPPTNGSPVSDFDGSYTGLQRSVEAMEARSSYGRTPSCNTSERPPPTLTIQNGTAAMRWCQGACTMTGQVEESGHIDLHSPMIKRLLSFSFIRKV